ncbi:MAG: ribosome silencing factor [Deltaproteobacteria bacterium]|nr:ribosome silencing factor [Deltaproteobacteria bacterium]
MGASHRVGQKDETLPTGSEAARRLALDIAAAGLDKKAAGVEIIDVCGKVDYTDFLVLMTGRSNRHVQAIAAGVEQDLRVGRNLASLSVEGLSEGSWVLLDFNDVVVHVFQQATRRFYDLEGLWIDARRVGLPEPGRRSGRPAPAP